VTFRKTTSGLYLPDQPAGVAVATPTAGLNVFSRARGGFDAPAWKDAQAQEHMAFPYALSWHVWQPNGASTTVSTVGAGITAIGTATAANFAVTNILTQARRISYISAATAGSFGGLRSSGGAQYWRSNVAGAGGWWFLMRFGFGVAMPAGCRWLAGMYSSTTNPTNVEPDTLLNVCGVMKGAADTNVQFFTNDGSGTATKSAGSSTLATPAVSEVWEFQMYAAPAGSTVDMSMEKLGGGGITTVSFNTKLPVNTQSLLPYLWATNNATAATIDPQLLHARFATAA
jgi:hypothetical protein